jgi:3-dehydroquinate synthase II/3-amino-4-hydroxybenzoic acid synthase
MTTYETNGLTGRGEKLTAARVAGQKNRLVDASARTLWFDAREGLTLDRDHALVERLVNAGLFTGVVTKSAGADAWAGRLPPRFSIVVEVDSADDLPKIEALRGRAVGEGKERVLVASADRGLLSKAKGAGLSTCLCAYVDDHDSLHASIAGGADHAYLRVRFRDPTNIPLELVIATLQATETVLVKEIAAGDVDDAIVTLGVMEVGADGVLFTPRSQGEYDALTSRFRRRASDEVSIEPATIVQTQPIGMGYRSCIDLATLFSETEGMIVGSTSQGGILCCPEVFFLPYMELRPFRVNAGAVHSYVYNAGDRTDYMSELRAGSPVLVVDASGKTRPAAVGRMKTEVRPLRLIEFEFEGGERGNVIMQDDWHVRVFSADAKPLNITELAPGDRVLAHRAKPGRHVGIAVDEHIVER